MSNEVFYDSEFKEGNLDSPEIIYGFIQPQSSVLDVGCSTGNLAEKLRKCKQCTVTGIDYNPHALNRASSRIDNTILVDLEREYYHGYTSLRKHLQNQQFDYIVMGDIYEHLKNGQSILKELVKYLTPVGKVVISVPNIQHITCRKNMLLGKFQYHNEGILDATHYRFFTAPSFKKEMTKLGFRIICVKHVGKLFFKHRSLLYIAVRFFFPSRKMYCRLQNLAARLFPSLFAYQIVALMETGGK